MKERILLNSMKVGWAWSILDYIEQESSVWGYMKIFKFIGFISLKMKHENLRYICSNCFTIQSLYRLLKIIFNNI